MSLKVLHAGDGYSYLTRQVATGDNLRSRGELMADYYTATGAPAGQWWGKGAEGLGVSGEVTEAQMRASYGEFLHPNADDMIKEDIRNGKSIEESVASARLGRKPLNFNNDIPFVVEMDARIKQFTTENQRVPDREERETLERIVGTELYLQEHEKAPDSDQLTAFIAEQKRRQRFPVSGYDLVFTPSKSVSVLWGIGDDDTRKAIMRAHQEAVEESLQWVEDNAIFSRAGAQGARHIDCEGAAVARFMHWDNRAGDPNLHTHCAVLNRVRCADGIYRTIDGQVLHRAAVTASETYNERVKDLVEKYAGVSFHAVEKNRSGQPVWEVQGIPDELINGFSRRESVLERGRELIEEYRNTYHREPSKSVQYRLMEQANLQTRLAKSKPRSLQDMVTSWRAQADTMSTDFSRDSVLQEVFSHRHDAQRERWSTLDRQQLISEVVDTVSRQRSVWTRFHIESEIRRRLATIEVDEDTSRDDVVAWLRDQALDGNSVRIDRKVNVPDRLTRADGGSIYRSFGSETYTSSAVLDAEKALSKAAVTWRINTNTTENLVTGRATVATHSGVELSAGQTAMVSHLLLSPSEIAVAIGAAGTGKTVAMSAFSRAWEDGGHRVFGLAPSAKAAAVLSESIGVEAVTIASMLHGTGRGELVPKIEPGDVLLVDEAGLASTRDLYDLYQLARSKGAFIRMVGDPQQLSSVDAGGILHDLAESTNAPVLSEVRRFTNPEEATITLGLREGDPTVLDWYEDNDRIVSGLKEELPGEVFSAWLDSTKRGQTALMIAGDNHSVDVLNLMARSHYLDANVVTPELGEASISGGRVAAVGDVVVTRDNNPAIRYGHNRSSFVKNGDLWVVAEVNDTSGLVLRHQDTGELVTVDADYARNSVQLGYASTIHRSQGMTVDEAFVLPSLSLDRQGLYVAMTRGRHLNKVFVPDDSVPDVDSHIHQMQAPSARGVLESIVTRDGRQVTAHAAIDAARDDHDLESDMLAYNDLVSSLARDYVLNVCDDNTKELLADDWQTTRLAQPLAQLSHTTTDLDDVVREVITKAKQDWDNRPEDKRPSLAFLIRTALEDHTGATADPAGDNLLWTVGLPVAPQWHTGLDDTLRDYLTTSADRIQHHLAQQGTRVLADGADWLEHFPEDDSASAEYATARRHAVRVIAAAACDPSRDTSTLSEWEEPFASIISRTQAHRRRTNRTVFDRMHQVELRHYIDHCTDYQHRLAERIEDLKLTRDHYLSLPSYRRVATDHDIAVDTAERIQAYRDLEQRVRAEEQRCRDINSTLRAEQTKSRLLRSARTIAELKDQLKNQVAHTEELREQRRMIGAKLPARVQWDRSIARASNTAQWEHDKDTAWMDDTHTIDDLDAQIESAQSDHQVWVEKQRIAESFMKAGKSDPELRKKLISDLREKLKRNRVERAAEKPATVQEESPSVTPREVGPRVAALRAELAKKRAERQQQQPEVDEVFFDVTRTVVHASEAPAPSPAQSVDDDPVDTTVTTTPQPDISPDTGVDF